MQTTKARKKKKRKRWEWRLLDELIKSQELDRNIDSRRSFYSVNYKLKKIG